MSARRLLLTGLPSLRARHLANELLASEPDSQLIALVHPERLAEATTLVEEFGSDRVELMPGDPAAIDFGVDAASYERLAADVQVVHAAYSITDGFVSETMAERVNLGAARELIEFARAARRLRTIAFYSSVVVSGQRAGRVLERELEAGQSFRNPVERSLALAERLLRRSDAPWLVLRAGHLLGDTTLGKVEALSGPYPLLVWVLSSPEQSVLPYPPGSEAELALTPVDHLARFGVFAASDAPARTTLHVIDPARPTLRQFLALAGERSGRRFEAGFNPSSFTRTLLGSSAAHWLPTSARDVFDVLRAGAKYDTSDADALLARGAPACPPLAAYLDQLLAHVRQRIADGNLPSPRRHEAAYLVS